jgi:ADP-glucose type glycogen/starch synthase
MQTETTASLTLSPEKPVVPKKRTKRGGRERPLRILLVTPEICDSEMLDGVTGRSLCVKAGGLADMSALLLDSLSSAGMDVHVALPNYRSLISAGPNGHSQNLHLCEDREFCYRQSVYEGDAGSNLRAAIAFQRDVIHYVLPRLRPDLVHCHDWMTGLIPAAAQSMGIPSLFTIHNLHDERATLGHLEDRGIDSAGFWNHLYYERFPGSYEETRDFNPISMLASGIFAANHVNTVSESFLHELSHGSHQTSPQVANAIHAKIAASQASGILNSLPENRSPATDPAIAQPYDAASHHEGKLSNKQRFQRILGLEENSAAPLFFWPSRLDPVQKGCQILTEILHQLVDDHHDTGIQIAFVADGPFFPHFENIVNTHGLHHRVAVRKFDDSLSRLGYAASDFILMPSSFEPCGLAQMIGLRYGSLPVVHATGGLRDTIRPLDAETDSGNGFPFEFHDAAGLRWAVGRAMDFHRMPAKVKLRNIRRIMDDAAVDFQPAVMIDRYLEIYHGLISARSSSATPDCQSPSTQP